MNFIALLKEKQWMKRNITTKTALYFSKNARYVHFERFLKCSVCDLFVQNFREQI